MSIRSGKASLFVIGGLVFLAAILGYLSMSIDVVAPIRKDHPYKSVQVGGCYQIFDRAYLDRPGCYVLQNDVVVKNGNEIFLLINSDNIDLNLNGKTVSGAGESSTQAGIYVDGGHDIIIRNGDIKDFMFGIRGETGNSRGRLQSIAIRDVNVTDASIIGIKLNATDVSLVDVTVYSQVATSDSERQYLFDISIDATRCLYSQTGARVDDKTDGITSLIRLPANCRISDWLQSVSGSGSL